MQDPIVSSTAIVSLVQLALEANCNECAGRPSDRLSQDVLIVLHLDSDPVHRLEPEIAASCHCIEVCIHGYNCVGRGTAEHNQESSTGRRAAV